MSSGGGGVARGICLERCCVLAVLLAPGEGHTGSAAAAECETEGAGCGQHGMVAEADQDQLADTELGFTM